MGRPGWGVSRKGFIFRHSEQRSEIQNPLQAPPMRHTGLDPVSPTSSEDCKNYSVLAIRPTMRPCISSAYRLTRPHFVAAVRFVKFRMTNISTPHSNSLPIGRENKKFLHNSFNYAIPGRIWIIRDVGKLIVSLHLTGLVRFRSLIASNRNDIRVAAPALALFE